MYELKGTMYELEALSATELHRLVAGGVTTVIAPFGSIEIGESLARRGFELIALISAHGGNGPALRLAAERLNRTPAGARACAPEGDVGPQAGSHSGEWLTSVMLALRPELVDVRAAADDLADELQAASAARGAEHLEQFVAAIVESVRAEAVAVGLSGWWRRLGRSAGRPRSRL